MSYFWNGFEKRANWLQKINPLKNVHLEHGASPELLQRIDALTEGLADLNKTVKSMPNQAEEVAKNVVKESKRINPKKAVLLGTLIGGSLAVGGILGKKLSQKVGIQPDPLPQTPPPQPNQFMQH